MALLTLDDYMSSQYPGVIDMKTTISFIFPLDIRPRRHYYYSDDGAYLIGFCSLVKYITEMETITGDKESAESIADDTACAIAQEGQERTLSDLGKLIAA